MSDGYNDLVQDKGNINMGVFAGDVEEFIQYSTGMNATISQTQSMSNQQDQDNADVNMYMNTMSREIEERDNLEETQENLEETQENLEETILGNAKNRLEEVFSRLKDIHPVLSVGIYNTEMHGSRVKNCKILFGLMLYIEMMEIKGDVNRTLKENSFNEKKDEWFISKYEEYLLSDPENKNFFTNYWLDKKPETSIGVLTIILQAPNYYYRHFKDKFERELIRMQTGTAQFREPVIQSNSRKKELCEVSKTILDRIKSFFEGFGVDDEIEQVASPAHTSSEGNLTPAHDSSYGNSSPGHTSPEGNSSPGYTSSEGNLTPAHACTQQGDTLYRLLESLIEPEQPELQVEVESEPELQSEPEHEVQDSHGNSSPDRDYSNNEDSDEDSDILRARRERAEPLPIDGQWQNAHQPQLELQLEVQAERQPSPGLEDKQESQSNKRKIHDAYPGYTPSEVSSSTAHSSSEQGDTLLGPYSSGVQEHKLQSEPNANTELNANADAEPQLHLGLEQRPRVQSVPEPEPEPELIEPEQQPFVKRIKSTLRFVGKIGESMVKSPAGQIVVPIFVSLFFENNNTQRRLWEATDIVSSDGVDHVLYAIYTFYLIVLFFDTFNRRTGLLLIGIFILDTLFMVHKFDCECSHVVECSGRLYDEHKCYDEHNCECSHIVECSKRLYEEHKLFILMNMQCFLFLLGNVIVDGQEVLHNPKGTPDNSTTTVKKVDESTIAPRDNHIDEAILDIKEEYVNCHDAPGNNVLRPRREKYYIGIFHSLQFRFFCWNFILYLKECRDINYFCMNVFVFMFFGHSLYKFVAILI